MKNQQSDCYKAAYSFIDAQKEQIALISNKSDTTSAILKAIVNKMQNDSEIYEHIGVIVGLNHNDCLLKLFREAKTLHQKTNSKEVQSYMLSIYGYTYQCFLKYAHQDYQDIYQYFTKASQDFKLQNHKHVISKSKLERYRIIAKEIGDVMNQVRKTGDELQKIKQINTMIKEYEIFKNEVLGSQECIQTYLQIEIEQIHIKIKNAEYGICCKLHFYIDQKIQSRNRLIEGYNHENEVSSQLTKWKQGFLDEARKYMVSYLNGQGGIYCYGLRIKDTQTVANGIQVSSRHKMDVMNLLLQQLALKIYPSGDQQAEQTQKQEESRVQNFRNRKSHEFSAVIKETKRAFSLTKYISVDFVNFYNNTTLFFCRRNQNMLYLIRIKISRGINYQTHFMENQKDERKTPQAYVLSQYKPSLLNIHEFLIKIRNDVKQKIENDQNQRMKNEERYKKNDKKKEFQGKLHELCRFARVIDQKNRSK